MNPHARSHLWVLLTFTIISLVVTFPLVFRMSDGIPYGGDGFQFIWNGWWFSKASSDPNLSLWFTPYQYAPVGSSLILHDFSPLNAAFHALFRQLIGDFLAHNLLIIFHYVLAAWGAYILAWYFTGNRAASVTAGIIFGFSTFQVMHLSQLSTISSGVIPIGIYYLVKYSRDGGWRDGLFGVISIIASAYLSWYNTVFLAVVFFLFFIIGQISLKEHFGGTKRLFRAFLPFVIAGVILSPRIIDSMIMIGEINTSDRISQGAQYFLNPILLVIPSPNHPLFGTVGQKFTNLVPGNITEGVCYLGILTALLGILSWSHKNPSTRVWCWVGLILFFLALGMKMYPTEIPGPFALWSKIPVLNLIRNPARFISPFTLALAMSVAGFLSAQKWTQKNHRYRTPALFAIPVIIIFETLAIPITISGKEFLFPGIQKLNSIYMESTGSRTPPDLIVNFPLHLDRPQFMLQQTVHEIPTINGSLSVPPDGVREFLLNFNWNPDNLKKLGVDLIVYQHWAAKTRLGEKFKIPENATGKASEWAGQTVEPLIFLRDVMGYKVIYEDEDMVVMLPAG